MKKGILLAFLLGSIFSMSLTSAYYFPSARFISQDLVYTITDFLEPILTALFGSYASGYTFEVLLLFLIISSIVYFVIEKTELFGGNKAVKWILTLAVPLMSVRFIDYSWLITIFDQYKLLGIVLSSIVPFILFFYFIYHAAGPHGVVRKAGWALFVAIYLGLWSAAYVDEFNSAVYFWTFIIGLVCLFGDNKIRKGFMSMEEAQREHGRINLHITRINEEIDRLEESLNKHTAHNPDLTKKTIRDLMKRRKQLAKD